MKFIFTSLLLTLISCTSMEKYQKLSVGQTGCAYTEIEISDLEEHRWVATCEEKSYKCNDAGVTPTCKIITEK